MSNPPRIPDCYLPDHVPSCRRTPCLRARTYVLSALSFKRRRPALRSEDIGQERESFGRRITEVSVEKLSVHKFHGRNGWTRSMRRVIDGRPMMCRAIPTVLGNPLSSSGGDLPGVASLAYTGFNATAGCLQLRMTLHDVFIYRPYDIHDFY